MNIISFNTNNGHTMKLVQRQHDGKTLIEVDPGNLEDEIMSDNEAFIAPADFVMLINYYRRIKRNDIQHDFINPYGTNKEGV